MPFINHSDLETYYEIHGQGDPLVLIHGLGSSCRDWELQIPALASKYQVIPLDLRGHGRSEKPPGPYSLALFAADTAGLIAELAGGSAHVLGISLGGMVAYQLALDHPGMARSLIVVNSTPDLVPRDLGQRLSLWQRFLIVRLLGMRRMGQVLADRFFPDSGQEGIKRIFVERWAENDKAAYLAAMKAAVGWSVRERLGEIRCPTLIIGAEGDYFPISEKEADAAMIPGSRLVIVPDARHALPAERPQEFNRLVLDFLNGLPP